MKRRELVVSLGTFGGAYDESVRVQRTSGYWAVVAAPGLWGAAGPSNTAATLESAEADYTTYRTLLLHIKKELGERRCPIRKDRHVKRSVATGELVLRLEACRALGPYLPTEEGRLWCTNTAALLEAAAKDDSFILLAGVKRTTTTELRLAVDTEAQLPIDDDGRVKPRRLKKARRAGEGEWSSREDALLVKWMGPRADGTRAPLKPAWVAMLQKDLPGRSMRAVRNRLTRLNKLLLIGLGSGEVVRVPSCFGAARLALQEGLWSVPSLYARYALGANIRVRAAMKRKPKVNKPSPLREQFNALRDEVAELRRRLDALIVSQN